MVDFNTDYWTGMDRKPIEKIELSPKQVGISMGIGDPWVQLKSAITAGASHVELGFMGVGKGSIQQPTGVTPGSISKEKREDIRQMAKINNVTLSTHASVGISGFSGYVRGKGFSEEAASEAVTEVKRAIDFAADTSEGGPVVVHTGEFERSISEAEPAKFEMFKGESEKAPIALVDKKTGEIVVQLPKDFTIPVVETVKSEDGREIPVIDPKTGEYKVKQWGYKDFIKKSKETGVPPEKLMLEEYYEKERLRYSAEEKRWINHAEEAEKKLNLIKNMIDSVKKLEKKNKDAANYSAIKYVEELNAAPPKQDYENYKEFLKNPAKYLDKIKNDFKREVDYAYENSVAAARQRLSLEEKKENIVPIQEFAVEKSAANIADMAMYAYETEKRKKLKKPMFIAPENVFPQQYGAHPQELKKLILRAREEMAKRLQQQKKLNKDEAMKIANEHIKATFDIGHANTWRRYFKGDDKEFKKWLNEQVKDLVKNKIIGHVHIADNFGYADEHLTPGQGNVPIEDFIKELKEAGLKEKIIIEPGAQHDGESIYSSMLGAWARVAGSPMYRIGRIERSWTDIEGSYFGRTFTPSYIVGKYAINPNDPEHWWSGVPLE